jgi:hypothetical protein
MTSPAFEAFLARLYTDEAFRDDFLDRPEETARGFGLDEKEIEELERLDLTGLELAAESFSRKRLWKEKHRPPPKWKRATRRILELLGIARA